MVKAFRPPKRTTAKRTSVVLPKRMIRDVEQSLVANGYGLRKRARWINEALDLFFQDPNGEALVQEEFIEPGLNSPISLGLEPQHYAQIKALCRHIEDETGTRPEIGAIIRTAIMQRLIREGI